MTIDRKLNPNENNMIDSCRKISNWGVYHNFKKNPDVISFNSELANKIFADLIRSSTTLKKVEYYPKTEEFHYAMDGSVKKKILEMVEWLDDSCSGYYVLNDYNIFFELEEDKALFLLKFVQ